MPRVTRPTPGLLTRVAQWWREKLAPKEVYIRINGKLRSLSLGALGQVALALGAMGVFGWIVYTSSLLADAKIDKQARLEQVITLETRYETDLAALQERYDLLAARLQAAQQRFTQVTAEMEAQHRHLVSILGKSSQLGKALDERREAYEERLPDEISRRNKKKTPVAQDGQSNILFPLTHEEDVPGLTILTARPPDLTAGAFRPEWQEAGVGFSALEAPLHMHGVLGGTGEFAIDSLIERLEQMDEEQQIISHHVGEILQNRLRHYETAIGIMGVFDRANLVERIERRYADDEATSEAGIGGAYVPLSMPQTARGQEAQAAQLDRTQSTLRHLEQADQLISHLPIVLPMRPPYYITSGYGPRIDPFTQKWAAHTGIDLASSDKNNRDVLATLPGKVVDAGNSINFGNMIRIDHGLGVTTLYGHLDEIYVSKGATVKQDQKIALIGNTGRSTGEHLHYEILINGNHVDPWKFAEAGKYVFKIKED